MADTPNRLKKELDTVVTLQADLSATERAIQVARESIEKIPSMTDTLDILAGLERTHTRLMSKVDSLYASLNVQDIFPELEGIPFEFVRVLLLARDLKINIRKRAIGSFFEWDKLDQAVGGGQKPLGKHAFFLQYYINDFVRNEAPPANSKSNRQTPASPDERYPQVQFVLW